MRQITRWCGFSCTLHLAALIALTLLSPERERRISAPVTVVLDRLAEPARAVPEKAAPARGPFRSARAPVRAPAPVQAMPVLAGKVQVQVAPHRPPLPANPEVARGGGDAPRAEAELPSARPPELPPLRSPELPQPPGTRTASTEGGGRASAVEAAAGASLPQGAQDQAQQRYLREQFAFIRELLARRMVYPQVARRMNWSGKVVLAFTIDEDGSVQELRVVQPSGFAILDKSALQTVRRAAPFPRPPVRAEIQVPVDYRIMP